MNQELEQDIEEFTSEIERAFKENEVEKGEVKVEEIPLLFLIKRLNQEKKELDDKLLTVREDSNFLDRLEETEEETIDVGAISFLIWLKLKKLKESLDRG